MKLKNVCLDTYDDDMLKLYIADRRRLIEEWNRHLKAWNMELEEAIWLQSQRLSKKLSKRSNSNVEK